MAGMWEHDCPVDGPIGIGPGEPCPWCGMGEKRVLCRDEFVTVKDREETGG